MKRLSPEISSYLSLSVGIAMPIIYEAITKASNGGLATAGLMGIVLVSVVGTILGALGTDDKKATGSQKIIAIAGITLNVALLAGSLFFLAASGCGCALNPNAKLF
jgi:hypothetical protein